MKVQEIFVPCFQKVQKKQYTSVRSYLRRLKVSLLKRKDLKVKKHFCKISQHHEVETEMSIRTSFLSITQTEPHVLNPVSLLLQRAKELHKHGVHVRKKRLPFNTSATGLTIRSEVNLQSERLRSTGFHRLTVFPKFCRERILGAYSNRGSEKQLLRCVLPRAYFAMTDVRPCRFTANTKTHSVTAMQYIRRVVTAVR